VKIQGPILAAKNYILSLLKSYILDVPSAPASCNHSRAATPEHSEANADDLGQIDNTLMT
jgi:hypothetical protein